MEHATLMELARELEEARRGRSPITALSDRFPEITVDEAYRVQLEIIRIKEEAGLRVIGKKIGLTNQAIREQIGVFEPDYGLITSEGLLADGGELILDNFIAPRIEPEIAFIMGKDLSADMAPITPWDVIHATRGVAPALEIVDSRVKDWRFMIQDTVADLASYGAVVLGNRITPLDGLDLRVLGMSAYKNGKLVQAGSSGNVMGNPINAVTWLANKLLKFGVELREGDIVLSGSFTPVFEIARGDAVQAIFDHLGEVALHVV